MCHRYDVPVVPGAYTATEALTAWEAGADLVKIFPASVGGPKYIKALKGPLPQIPMVPVGGVNLDTTADFIRAGSEVVGVGGSLINQKLLDAKEFETITANARRYREEVQKGRSG
jgi:2-dehydro-3-deoxyphosphogluconate aldolase/(4S)-4-hydroxy-2-oxoglutarate aldolase